ncbi:MAG: hypothetical protein WCZ89_06885, partial [Phycisphaerae bacterium]
EQVPRIKSQSSEKPVWAAVAAIIIVAVVIGAFFIFNRPKPKAQMVKTLQVHEALKIAEPNAKQTDEAKKLQKEIEHIVALARAGDVKGLRLVLDEGSESAKMLAAEYLEKMLTSHIDKLPQGLEDEIIPQDTNVSSLLSGDILEAADQNEILIDAAIEDKPRIISVNPPSGSEMPLASELEVVFDRPMDANEFEIWSEDTAMLLSGIFETLVAYDISANKFLLPLRLPANWNGQIILQNFVSADGIEAEPLAINYHTFSKPFSDKLLSRFEKHSNSYELIDLMEKIKNARMQLNSLSMTVQSVMNSVARKDLDDRTYRAIYKFQGDSQVYAKFEFDIMNRPYHSYIACDGTYCWHYSDHPNRKKLTIAALEDIDGIIVDICNPFGIKDNDVFEAIEQHNLQYEGINILEGRKYFLVRSWLADKLSQLHDCSVSLWWFDAETYLPVQVFYDYAGQNTELVKFTYQKINEPIPYDTFTYNSVTDMEPVLPELFTEEYESRYLILIDGTSNGGRMSNGWQSRGRKGTSTTGIN